MGRLNSLSGLNNVSVDFRPTIQVNEQKPSDANRLLPDDGVVPGEAQPPQKAEARSIVQKLNDGGKVYGKEQWRDWNKIVAMTGVKANVTITKVNDDKLKVGGDIEIVSDYNERNCPSFFKREYLHKMFNKPV